MAFWLLPVFLLFTSLQHRTAIRLQLELDDPDNGTGEDQEAATIPSLSVVQDYIYRNTFRNLFSPLYPGKKYYIQDSQGQYLTAVGDGTLRVTELPLALSEWIFETAPRTRSVSTMPELYVRNGYYGSYLSPRPLEKVWDTPLSEYADDLTLPLIAKSAGNSSTFFQDNVDINLNRYPALTNVGWNITSDASGFSAWVAEMPPKKDDLGRLLLKWRVLLGKELGTTWVALESVPFSSTGRTAPCVEKGEWKLILAEKDFSDDVDTSKGRDGTDTKAIEKARRRQYKQDWNIMKQLPVFVGTSSMTWDQMCIVWPCEEWYVDNRFLLTETFEITENTDHKVLDNNVRGLCSMSVEALKIMTHSDKFIWEFFSSAYGNQGTCPESAFTDFSANFDQAVETICFGDCMTRIREKMENYPNLCVDFKYQNWTEFFSPDLALSSDCIMQSSDALESLAEYLMQKKCWTWSPPWLLWTHADDEYGGLKSYSPDAVCSVPEWEAPTFTGWVTYFIDVNGKCPEGTQCNAPNLKEQEWPTTSQIRGGDVDPFVFKGSSLVYSVATDVAMNTFASAAIMLLTPAAYLSPISIYSAIVSNPRPIRSNSFHNFYEYHRRTYYQQKPQDSVGCWPRRPRARQTEKYAGKSCRTRKLKATDYVMGLSRYYFVPPPGLKMRRRGSARMSWCALAPCTTEELLAQKVGLGNDDEKSPAKPNVYNCQPLTFKNMDGAQREKFRNKLKESGAFERNEYIQAPRWSGVDVD